MLKAKDPQKIEPRKPVILAFGEPNVGKTWACLDFPRSYFIDSEHGASRPHYAEKLRKSKSLYMGPDEGADDFATVIEQVRLLSLQKHDRLFLVIDSLSKLFDVAVQEEYDKLTRAGKSTDYAKDKKPAVAKTKQLILALNQLDMTSILICHEVPEYKDDKQVGSTFDAWNKMKYELDLVLQILPHGKVPNARVVKTRYEQLKKAEILPWSYDSICEKFGSELINAEPKPRDMATPDQVKEAEHWLNESLMSPATVSKWLEAGGTNQWAGLETGQIAKCIDSMKRKAKKGGVVA